MNTIDAVELARICYMKSNKCPGDSGEIKCFFCPACILSLSERVYNLQMFNLQVYNSKGVDEL